MAQLIAQGLADGESITHEIGRYTITVQAVRPGAAYTVTTYQGGTLRIEEHCKSWPTETDARAYARMLVHHYRNVVRDEQDQPAPVVEMPKPRPAALVAYLAVTERGNRVHKEISIRPGHPDCDGTETISSRIGQLPPPGSGEAAFDQAFIDLGITPARMCAHCFPAPVRKRVAARSAAGHRAA